MRKGLAVALVVAAAPAWADNFNLFGYGPRASAMGGALTASASDYTAAYYNPALLVNRTEANVGFHFQWYRMMARVERKDLATELDCTYCNAPDAAGYGLGLLFPLGGKVKNRVAFGLGLYLPSARMLRVLAVDPSRPFWYRYNSNPDRIVIHTGLGIRITDWLTIGAGIQALADLLGNGANVKVDLFSKQVKMREIDSFLATRVGPVFGVQLAPVKGLRFGATFRWEMKLVYEIPASVELEGVGTLAFAVKGVAHYTPHNVSFGVAWDPVEQLTLSLDGEYMNWSAGPSPYSDLVIDVGGPTLEALGLGTALDNEASKQAPGFADTFSGRLGGEYRLSERFSARVGLSYRPTPVPRQNVVGANMMDASTLGLHAGIGFNFPDPLEIFQHPIQVDVATQGLLVLPREANKEPTDPVPSYTYSAQVFGLTAAVRYDF